jgi:hypothetical protein
MKWHEANELPEQGKKILCMDQGDFYVAQRFGPYWFSIPFYDSKHSRYNPPEKWAKIDFPKPYKGCVEVFVEGKMYSIDEIEKFHPDIHKILVKGQLELFERMKNAR